jgi:hypothetical protein
VYTLEAGRGIIYIYILIVVCIDGKKYITDNEPQRDTEISVKRHHIYSFTKGIFFTKEMKTKRKISGLHKNLHSTYIRNVEGKRRCEDDYCYLHHYCDSIVCTSKGSNFTALAAS